MNGKGAVVSGCAIRAFAMFVRARLGPKGGVFAEKNFGYILLLRVPDAGEGGGGGGAEEVGKRGPSVMRGGEFQVRAAASLSSSQARLFSAHLGRMEGA